MAQSQQNGQIPIFAQALSPFNYDESNILLDEFLFDTFICHANQVYHYSVDI